MKFKVGDKVRVKSLEWFETLDRSRSSYRMPGRSEHFTLTMQEFCGKVVTIRYIDNSRGKGSYNIFGDDFHWYDWMFEDYVEPNLYLHPFCLSKESLVYIDDIKYRVSKSLTTHVWLVNDDRRNDVVFEKLKIRGGEVRRYVESILGYYISGLFPECKSLEDLTTLTLALAEEAQKHGIEVKIG
jgi:hypothetical protein